ncbi:MAG: DUF1003 domain-containing protein [Chloroflexota bacterium]|jgi:uncharacterized membrane protein
MRQPRNPINQLELAETTRGERIADDVARFIGSWRFLVLQTAIVALWIAGNVVALFHFDPYPFILLNLAFSTQAAYAAPLILLASNRASQRDRLTLEHASTEADLEEQQNEEILAALEEIKGRLQEIERAVRKP